MTDHTPKRNQGGTKHRKFSQASSVVGGADWAECASEILSKFTAAATKDGGAVRYGYTRDGNTYALGIYGDGDPYTLYCPAATDITEWLTARLGELQHTDKHG